MWLLCEFLNEQCLKGPSVPQYIPELPSFSRLHGTPYDTWRDRAVCSILVRCVSTRGVLGATV